LNDHEGPDTLARSFGALLRRVRTVGPGWLVLEFVRRDDPGRHDPRP
jgi:hypothetical protein